jgi:hypothetical protein
MSTFDIDVLQLLCEVVKAEELNNFFYLYVFN